MIKFRLLLNYTQQVLQVICNKNWHVCIFHVDLCPGIPVFACSLIWKNKRALEPALEPDCQVVPLGEPSLCLGLFQHLGHSKLTQASLQTPQQKVQHGISRSSTDHLCISVTWSLDYGVTTNNCPEKNHSNLVKRYRVVKISTPGTIKL